MTAPPSFLSVHPDTPRAHTYLITGVWCGTRPDERGLSARFSSKFVLDARKPWVVGQTRGEAR